MDRRQNDLTPWPCLAQGDESSPPCRVIRWVRHIQVLRQQSEPGLATCDPCHSIPQRPMHNELRLASLHDADMPTASALPYRTFRHPTAGTFRRVRMDLAVSGRRLPPRFQHSMLQDSRQWKASPAKGMHSHNFAFLDKISQANIGPSITAATVAVAPRSVSES